MKWISDSEPSGKAPSAGTRLRCWGRRATARPLCRAVRRCHVKSDAHLAAHAAAPLLGICRGEMKAYLCSPRNLDTSAGGSFANSHPHLGTTHVPRWVIGQTAGSRTWWRTAQWEATTAHAAARVTVGPLPDSHPTWSR